MTLKPPNFFEILINHLNRRTTQFLADLQAGILCKPFAASRSAWIENKTFFYLLQHPVKVQHNKREKTGRSKAPIDNGLA